MKKLLTFFAILAALMVVASAAQAQLPMPDTLWTRTYGGISWDWCKSVKQTPDLGFILCGYTLSIGPAGDNMLLIKTDPNGNLQWYHIYGGSGGDAGFDVVTTRDGGYALAGQTSSYGTGTIDFYLVKTDARGNLEWQRTFGGGGGDICRSLQQTSDGGFILGGYSTSFSGGYDDMFVVKTDSQGNLEWQQTYGGNGIDGCYAVQQTTDGGFILAGSYQDNTLGLRMWLVKTDALGSMQWDQTFGYAGSARAFSVRQTSAGGYALAGYESLNGPNLTHVYLAKTDSLGQPEWEFYNIGEEEETCYSVLETPDNGFLLAGGDGLDIMLWKVSNLGTLQWIDRFLGSQFPLAALKCYSMAQTTDGQFILGGARNGNSSSYDIYLMRIEGLQQAGIGLAPQGVPITIPPTGGSFQFNVSITNCGTIPCRPDAWIMVQLPSGSWYGPVLGPIALTLPAGGNLERLRTQNVPGSAPAGTYTYRGYVGDYPAKWDSSSFTFEKLAAGDWGLEAGDWANSGEDFSIGAHGCAPLSGSGATPTMKPLITSVSPNPFNAATVLSFEMRDASFVKLSVLDIAGRHVGSAQGRPLREEWMEAGTHEISFDGSHLPSGIYLYRIEAGQYSASGKMLLLK